MNQIIIGNFMILASLVPLAFLIYTLANLESLQISATHPRVFVELSIFIFLLLVGLYLRLG